MGYHDKGTLKGQRKMSALTSFRLRPCTLKVTLQPCCFHCEQKHLISNHLQEEEGVFKVSGVSNSKKEKGPTNPVLSFFFASNTDFILKDKHPRTFLDQKLEEVCHVVSLLMDCEAHMITLDLVPKVLSTSIVNL